MVVLCDLVEIMYWISIVKIIFEVLDDFIIGFDECMCGQDIVECVLMCVLMWLWQMLLKFFEEVGMVLNVMMVVEMVIICLIYVVDLFDFEVLICKVQVLVVVGEFIQCIVLQVSCSDVFCVVVLCVLMVVQFFGSVVVIVVLFDVLVGFFDFDVVVDLICCMCDMKLFLDVEDYLCFVCYVLGWIEFNFIDIVLCDFVQCFVECLCGWMGG